MANPDTKVVERIAICGAGLAARMTAAGLAQVLPASIEITLVICRDASDTDLLYGNVTAPSAYAFNLSAGVSEPSLVLDSDTAFSWGTKYDRWGGEPHSWIQCFHLPLPVLGGVLFHHYLSRLNIDALEPFLVSAMAARAGAFAHPPEQSQQPLSRAEHGYQFDPRSYARLFETAAPSRLETVVANLVEVHRGENGIRAIDLADGRSIAADLYVDCTGPAALLAPHESGAFRGERAVRVAASRRAAERLGPPYRTVTAEPFGWQADTPLQGSLARLTIAHPDSEREALAAHGEVPERTAEARLGARAAAWNGNCVAIGHAAAVLEPLTPAPMMLLERDIERLLSLIPVTSDMSVERREFNRRFAQDYEHAGLFNRALFEAQDLPEGPYWREARDEPVPEKLARKLEHFRRRGLLVAFDLEPFNAEDWTILHYGMGHSPARHDRFADQPPEAQVRQHLANMKREIETLVNAMPSHGEYMTNLRRYLMQERS